MDSVYIKKSKRLKLVRSMVMNYTLEAVNLDRELKEIDVSIGQTHSGGGSYKGSVSTSKREVFLILIKKLFRNG